VPPTSSIRIVEAGLECLGDVRRTVRTGAAAAGAGEEATDDLVQAVDEWVTNVILHGYRGGSGPVEVTVERVGEDLVVRVRDEAPVFDPATVPPFDSSVPLERRRLGGMGVHLMRELTDAIEHRAAPGGGNQVTLRRRLHDRNDGGDA
jgi:serine/threonine-protein kinase RsbW